VKTLVIDSGGVNLISILKIEQGVKSLIGALTQRIDRERGEIPRFEVLFKIKVMFLDQYLESRTPLFKKEVGCLYQCLDMRYHSRMRLCYSSIGALN
jgi:hypothetical protein